MKKLVLVALGSILFFSCQQEKTAFVDNEKLIEESQEKKDLEAQYNTKIESFGKKKDSVGKAFQIEVQEFQAKADKLAKAKAQEMYQSLGQKQQFLQQQLQMEEQGISKNFQTKIDSLLSKVDSSIEDYGKANGYSYIFGKNKAGSVLYGSDKNDITEAVIEKLNKEYSDNK
ncbi:OmpH family outer membrane protein [Pseudofulvibacter geojedonensis]|uniref:OmpH family outer membrane protein n=1 Tax=Pseudofulvibacter geojedonensis TaxID=1123758 RepID=A0ABW3I451_9FLAO